MRITNIKIRNSQAWLKAERGTFQTTDKEIIEAVQEPVPEGYEWVLNLDLDPVPKSRKRPTARTTSTSKGVKTTSNTTSKNNLSSLPTEKMA